MRSIISLLFVFTMLTFISSCKTKINKEAVKEEIFKTEKAFEAATKSIGVAEAFGEFADDSAVIIRGENNLIKGKAAIKQYYEENTAKNAEVSWAPDFIEVSDDGTLGYTYGKYTWKSADSFGKTTESKGIFHTVWKRQADGSWKYVWD
ncbi:MAG TPA: nuclear transport factor 2 family protein [Bacteroidales bacterium]|nr:nuclear transport factor 2 family protein [Bacteroidales bacterium]